MPSNPPLKITRLLESGQTVRIACLGDSITGVYYHSGGRRAWPEVLGDYLRQLYPATLIVTINAGISGNTSGQGLARLDADVLAQSPDLVVVMFGMNDTCRSTPEEYRNNLCAIIQRITAQGAGIILMTPNYVYDDDPLRPLSRVAEYADIVRQIGREHMIPVADAFAAFRDVKATANEKWMRLMSDPIHPNMRGHRLFSTLVTRIVSGQEPADKALPVHPVQLPRLKHVTSGQRPLKIVAMTPLDSLLPAALSQLFPSLTFDVTPWETAGKTIADLEEDVLRIGWTMYRENPVLTEPDLFIVTPPCAMPQTDRESFYRSFAMILNRTQSFGEPRWDCLIVLPSVLNPVLSETEKEIEQLTLMGALDKDLPFICRMPGETAAASSLLTTKLAALLQTRVGQSS